jgi:hypothetical protein
MIVYELACKAGHAFEGWYASPDAFDTQRDAGHLECPVCGTEDVLKRPSAPHVHTQPAARPASPASAAQGRAMGELRAFILANTEDVGRKFAEIARRIHYGEEAHRGIRGQVTVEEAVDLQEEGIPATLVQGDLETH